MTDPSCILDQKVTGLYIIIGRDSKINKVLKTNLSRIFLSRNHELKYRNDQPEQHEQG